MTSIEPRALEPLARACQVVVGCAMDWSDLPDREQFLSPFDAVPASRAPYEVLAMETVLFRFSQEIGTMIHRNFHARYAGATCHFHDRAPLFSRMSPARTLQPRERLAEWYVAYERVFEQQHPTNARRARRIMERSYAAALTANELAAELGTTARTIERQFREENGETLQQCRTRLRVTAAMQLLRKGIGIKTVAWQVGWKNKKDLYGALRRLTNVSVADLRRLSDEDFNQLIRSMETSHRDTGRAGSLK